jgi:beta-1,4-mannosyl-glycoprotein beta-1,4-N-acetylglucosaminyltransferase
MIVDTFLFGWELDMLEFRLSEMSGFVDWFVLVESDMTFQGESKPFVFDENKDRFKDYWKQIIYVRADLPETDDPWLREYSSREATKKGLVCFSDSDIILHGDVDEIMSSSIGGNLDSYVGDGIGVLDQDFYSMAVDWKYPDTWQGTVMARAGLVEKMSMTDFRNSRIYASRIRGGWHFSWLGGPEMITKKAAAFSHTEDSVQSYIRDMGAKLYFDGYHVLGEKLIPVDIDETYPKFLVDGNFPSEWLRPRT